MIAFLPSIQGDIKVGNPLGEKPEQNPNPWAPPKGTYIEELFLKNTDPDKVMFELDVYWAVMGQQDPVEWMENYPNRFKLLHIISNSS